MVEIREIIPYLVYHLQCNNRRAGWWWWWCVCVGGGVNILHNLFCRGYNHLWYLWSGLYCIPIIYLLLKIKIKPTAIFTRQLHIKRSLNGY